MKSFDIETFASRCVEAMAAADNPQEAAAALLAETLSENDLQDIIRTLDAAIPKGADIGEMIVHRSPTLTMLYARVPPRFQSGIHDHTVFACIGQLSGEERNILFEPAADGEGLTVESTAKVRPGEVLRLPADAVHCIENPGHTVASALHLYGGDFAALMDDRSLWSTTDHQRQSFSFPALLRESALRMREDNNEAGLNAIVEAIPATKAMVDNL